MVGLALLGAGIFAREEHLPAIEACPQLSLKAVYSRSQNSADGLAAASASPSSVDTYYDSPETPDRTLEVLLARSDIEAVIVCLPILTQPAVIRRAIQAGKHVLSEKPVAGEMVTGRTLVEWHSSLADPPIWAVAENFRFTPSLDVATQKVRGLGGQLVAFRLSMCSTVKVDNKYFNTDWRKSPSHQGGFLLDGGVHFVAGLRALLGAAGQQIKQLVCYSALLDPKLPPVDTVVAVATTQNGRSGPISISFGTEFKSGLEIEVVTTNGAVSWSPTTLKVVQRSASGNKAETTEVFPYTNGVTLEVKAFAESIKTGIPNALQTPLEGLRDLELLQGLLESGDGNGAVRKMEL